MSERRRPEAALELPVKIFLASISHEHRHRFDLDPLTNERSCMVEANPGQPLAHWYADLAPEYGAQVSALPVELGGERLQRDRFRVRLFDAIHHVANVQLRG
ncbi:MAG TPA: hypothetical protein VGD94_15725 [Vicinamibacterales bacterium]